MQQIYQAHNIVDAHLVKGLLEQAGITAFVSGYYLHGGVGELPASGMNSLWVHDEHVSLAEQIIADFQQEDGD